MDNDFNYDDVSHYTLEAEDEQALIGAQNECTFMWCTKEGWPVGVIMSYVYDRGYFWLSVSSLRVRVQAVAREPRTSISITSKGCNMEAPLSLTYKGTCEVLSDQETIDWFLPTLAKRLRAGDEQAQKEFVRLNNTPNRRVLKFKPVKKIGFDSRKMRRATLKAGQG